MTGLFSTLNMVEPVVNPASVARSTMKFVAAGISKVSSGWYIGPATLRLFFHWSAVVVAFTGIAVGVVVGAGET